MQIKRIIVSTLTILCTLAITGCVGQRDEFIVMKADIEDIKKRIDFVSLEVNKTPEPTPTPSPTPKPTPTLEPTPFISRDDALKKLNITSKEIYQLSQLNMFECTLKNGKHVSFLTVSWFRILDDGLFEINLSSVLDDVVVASFTTDKKGGPTYDIMDEYDVTLIPEFLQGAIIETTYNVVCIPTMCEAFNLPVPKSPYMDLLAKYFPDDYLKIEQIYMTSEDSANFMLDIIPYDQILWASDYIDGYMQETTDMN